MPEEELIVIDDFCLYHQVDRSFIQALDEAGLIEITQTGNKWCVHETQLPQLEKMTRLYYDLEINVEGIETVTYLLDRLIEMHQQIKELEEKLNLYQTG